MRSMRRSAGDPKRRRAAWPSALFAPWLSVSPRLVPALVVPAVLVSGLLLAGCAAQRPLTPAERAEASIATAVLDSGRPAAHAARDDARKPARMLAFAGVKPGAFVGEMFPGEGYYTRLLSRTVGPLGRVIAVVPADTAQRLPSQIEPVRVIAATPAYANVTVETPNGAPTPSIMVDIIWTSQNYHDIHAYSGAEAAANVNRSAFAALKRGGIYLVVDHSAQPGSGARDAKTLHRIDKELVKQEVLAAGFVLDGETFVLSNPADTRALSVFDPAIRDKTDQFALRFRKP